MQGAARLYRRIELYRDSIQRRYEEVLLNKVWLHNGCLGLSLRLIAEQGSMKLRVSIAMVHTSLRSRWAITIAFLKAGLPIN